MWKLRSCVGFLLSVCNQKNDGAIAQIKPPKTLNKNLNNCKKLLDFVVFCNCCKKYLLKSKFMVRHYRASVATLSSVKYQISVLPLLTPPRENETLPEIYPLLIQYGQGLITPVTRLEKNHKNYCVLFCFVYFFKKL